MSFPTVLSKALAISAVLLGCVFILIVSYSVSERICVQSSSLVNVQWRKTLIPSCASGGSAEWSKESIKGAHSLNRQIEAFQFLVPSRKFKIQIVDNTSNLNIDPRTVILPEYLTEATDLVPYTVVKYWVEDQNRQLKHFDLLHETLAHFIFYAISGREPILPSAKIQLPPIYWKPIQNTSHSNCINDWKLTRKWHLCINRHYQFFETRTDFIKERLQHRFNVSWVRAYQRLSMREKNQLFKFVLGRIKTFKVDESLLKDASFSNYIKSMSSFWQSNEYFPFQEANKEMLASIIKDFNQINFVNIVDRSRFDLVIFKEGLRLNSFKADDRLLRTLRKKESALVAVSNGDDFSIFPIKKTIKLSSFSKWYANQIVVESCQPLRMKELLKYSAYTEKLLLIYTCNPLALDKIALITRSGILNYAQMNNEEMFAHFHLPSLISKRDLIDPNLEVFQFLTERSQKNSVYELFGWQELNWDQISKSYRPKAIVDAVNLFRVQM